MLAKAVPVCRNRMSSAVLALNQDDGVSSLETVHSREKHSD
jgi:hypothetical protein